jgi:hypothetical protein
MDQPMTAHAHNHDHGHSGHNHAGHSHAHPQVGDPRYGLAIGLNLLIVLIEAGGGFYANSNPRRRIGGGSVRQHASRHDVRRGRGAKYPSHAFLRSLNSRQTA